METAETIGPDQTTHEVEPAAAAASEALAAEAPTGPDLGRRGGSETDASASAEHPGNAVEDPGDVDDSDDAVEDPGDAAEAGRPASAEASSRPDLDDPDTLRAAVESVLFIADAPVTVTALATGLQRPMPEIQAALTALAGQLDERGSGVELREIGEGVRLYTRSHLAGWVEAFLMDGQRVRLTQAALETLAVIAYRQPVTRARISAIRGVNVDGVVRTLITRGLITEVGADPDTGGGLYRTTELFLEKMALRSIDELPSLAPLLPELNGLESDELSG
jgi:segregation and condensation protein B